MGNNPLGGPCNPFETKSELHPKEPVVRKVRAQLGANLSTKPREKLSPLMAPTQYPCPESDALDQLKGLGMWQRTSEPPNLRTSEPPNLGPASGCFAQMGCLSDQRPFHSSSQCIAHASGEQPAHVGPSFMLVFYKKNLAKLFRSWATCQIKAVKPMKHFPRPV